MRKLSGVVLGMAGAAVALGLTATIRSSEDGSNVGGARKPAPECVLACTVIVEGEREYVEVLRCGDRPATVARFEGQRPLWSPDGRHIAFGGSAEHGPTEVWLSDASGGAQRRLTDHGGARHSSWAPGGDRIYYTVQDGGDSPDFSQVWCVSIDDARKVHLSDGLGDDNQPLACPVPSLVAFQRRRPGETGPPAGDIWVMGADGSNAHAVTAPPHGHGHFGWTPDGQWLFYSTSEGIDASALSRAQAAMAEERPVGVREMTELGFALSIYRVRPDGRSRGLVIQGAPVAAMPVCSPAGDLIAYVAPDASEAGDIYVAKIDGSGIRNVSHHEADESAPKWSPDGTMLGWLRVGDGRESGVVLVELASGSQSIVARNTAQRVYTSFDWRPPAED